MKKTLKVILFSCSIGILLASLFFFNIKEKATAKNKPVLYAFQVGVFKNRENANNYKAKFRNAKVIFDQDYYRVFIGVTSTNKDLLSTIFKDYNFYIKELTLSEEIIENIQKYDEILLKANEENKILILKNMLESLPNEL